MTTAVTWTQEADTMLQAAHALTALADTLPTGSTVAAGLRADAGRWELRAQLRGRVD